MPRHSCCKLRVMKCMTYFFCTADILAFTKRFREYISFYKYYLHFFKKYNLFIPLFYNFIENGYTDKTNTERSIYFMKWIDYTALTLAIIGAIAWGLIGIFQFNLVSFFFGENSWFSRLIYDLVGLSGLYLLTLFGRIGRDM